ncbi:GWxTD domain-containing protein [Rubrivirga sp. S365]|uniref:GWxTD domain-containing protein n=1 Tax=Rubrivirga litoralis TaxID=3075598 RepID=A0ABU3BQW8_9BACT|nr:MULTISPECIES: GWxTD domain-containing protein [unclassified Rubrivirga]MDT0631581.1 GWxTD domain-containing protein [Rubrivirga sp. F394]MDT7857226.1 GWxTD domain-containing protein [Rubrivirga sp. S365]
MTPRPGRLWGGALALALLAGCGGGARLDGSARAYQAGAPDIAFDAVAAVRDGSTGVDAVLTVYPASLTYRPARDSLEAVAEWTLRVGGAGRSEFVRGVDTVRVASAEAARAAPPHVRTERVEVAPGAYRVEATVTDVGADRTARRAEAVTVRPARDRAWLSGPRLVGASGRPLDALRVPARLDSVRVVVQAAAPEGSSLAASVVRFEADTTVAAPPSGATTPPTSLAARGVNVGAADTVAAVEQAVPAGVSAVGVDLPALAPGVYGVRLELRGAAGQMLATVSRRVVVRRRDFPLVTRRGDLIAPLVYLADAGETEALGRGGQRTFDAFWGAHVDDRGRAAEALRAFYGRVEEANRLFSNQKAGWATDPGLVYVVFGPPDAVAATATTETWTYRRGETAPPQVVFDRTAGRAGGGSPFDVLTLRRDRRYEDAWRAARAAWRAGRVP